MRKDDASEVLLKDWGDKVADEAGVRHEGDFAEWRCVVEIVINDIGARLAGFDWSRWEGAGRGLVLNLLVADEELGVFVANYAFNDFEIRSVAVDFWRFDAEVVAGVEVIAVPVVVSFRAVFIDIVDGDSAGVWIWVAWLGLFFRSAAVAHDVDEIFVAHGAANFDDVGSVAVDDGGVDAEGFARFEAAFIGGASLGIVIGINIANADLVGGSIGSGTSA